MRKDANPVLLGFDLAIAAAVYAVIATGGVSAPTQANIKMNICAASGVAPISVNGRTRQVARMTYVGVGGIPQPRMMVINAVRTAAT